MIFSVTRFLNIILMLDQGQLNFFRDLGKRVKLTMGRVPFLIQNPLQRYTFLFRKDTGCFPTLRVHRFLAGL